MSESNASVYSEFLFARPSFLEGMSRVVDFGNHLKRFNSSSSNKVADERAIRADWEAVGNDIRHATTEVSKKVAGND